MTFRPSQPLETNPTAPGCPPAQAPFSSSSPANRVDGVQSARLGVALPPRSPSPAQERQGRSTGRPSHELGGGLVPASGEAGGRRTRGGRLAAPPAGRRVWRGHDEHRDRAEAEEHEAVAAVPDSEVAEVRLLMGLNPPQIHPYPYFKSPNYHPLQPTLSA